MGGLYISASGIANALRRNDVRANNIANIRTPGYRAARPESTETSTGGAAVSSVHRDDSAGPIEFTGQATDVAASTGFFAVLMADGSLAYTRDGRFGLNAEGEIVTSDGARLEPSIQAPAGATGVTVAGDGTVLATLPGGGPQVIGRIEVFQFQNAGGLAAIGGNLYQETAASGVASPVSTAVQFYPGAVQQSNVDLARETVGGILDRQAVQANVNAFRAQADILGELIDITA